jgi:hypothetical protein
MNATLSSVCSLYIKLNNTYDIITQILRVLIFLFSFLWALIAYRFKDLRSPQMACMWNLCILCIFITISYYIIDLFEICHIETKVFCLAVKTLDLFKDYYTGYSLCAICIHRLACITFSQLVRSLKWKNSVIFLAIFWLLSFLFSLIQVFLFDSNVYMHISEQICVLDTSNQTLSFIFFIAFSILLPNFIIITLSAVALKKLTIKNIRLVKMDNKAGHQRVGLMLILVIIMFELYCISNAILFYRKHQTLNLTNDDFVYLLILSKWLFHISSLALLYSHPNLTYQYKKLLMKYNLKRNSVGIVK